MNLRTMAFAAIATIAFGTSAVSFAQTAPGPGPQGTPPPPPVPGATSSPLITTSPEPTPLPSGAAVPAIPSTTPTPPLETAAPAESPSPQASEGRGRHHRGGSASAPSPEASPSETPEPPQFSTLDGVWEVALQPLNGARTIYSHLYVTQQGNTLTGTWRRGGPKTPPSPFTGTFDGRLFKLTVTDGDKTEQLSGYEENFMDIVGLYTDGDPKHQGTPFTAAHRKSAKERERDEKSLDTQHAPGHPQSTGSPLPR